MISNNHNISNRIILPMIELLRYKSFTSKFDLSEQMKKFNYQGDYRKSLALFTENPSARSDACISQALKACSKLQDFQRGKEIHQQLKSRSINNSFIQTSLINLYSRFTYDDY